MAAAFVEHRPLSTDRSATTTHHVVVSATREVGQFKTQKEAAEWAQAQGFRPVHVARERHLKNSDVPDNGRHYP